MDRSPESPGALEHHPVQGERAIGLKLPQLETCAGYNIYDVKATTPEATHCK